MIGRWVTRRRWQRANRVLAYLADGRQHHVGELVQRYGEPLAATWDALHRLENAGHVESGWVDGPYPRRRWYRKVELLGLAVFCDHGVGMLDQCDDCCPEEATA